MENLKIHSGSKSDYLVALKKQFEKLVTKIKTDFKLNESQKKEEIEKAEKEFILAKKDADANLF